MAFDPLPLDLMSGERAVETLPEIDVFHRFFLCGFPAALFPVMDPAGDALTHILAVGAQDHVAGLFQRFQRHNCRHQLHAIIGGEPVTGAEQFFVLAVAQNRAVAAGTWIAKAGSVGEYFYLLAHLW